MPVTVGIGVLVGALVCVAVLVGVGVFVGSPVAICVGVLVGVLVGLGLVGERGEDSITGNHNFQRVGAVSEPGLSVVAGVAGLVFSGGRTAPSSETPQQYTDKVWFACATSPFLTSK